MDQSFTDLPATRSKAKLLGAAKYITGQPCIHGHFAPRWTTSGTCFQCSSEKASAKWAAGKRQRPEIRQKANDTWNASQRAYEAKLRWKRRNPHRAWAVFVRSGARQRANQYNLPFDLDVEFVLSIAVENCPALGVPLRYLDGDKVGDFSATLDRIRPELGYVRGNVAVISRRANMIKSNANADEIERVAAWLRTAI